MRLTNLFFFKILRGAILEVVGKWRPLLQALVLPAALMMAANYATQYVMRRHFEATGSIEGLTVLAYSQLGVWILLYALFGMSSHRIILTGGDSLPHRFGIYWTMRETRFLGWLVLVGIIHMLLTFPFQYAIAYLRPYVPPEYIPWQIATYVPMLLATYMDGRVSMVLPATAVGERSSIVESWHWTRGRGLHIAAALLIAAVASDLLAIGTRAVLEDLPLAARLVSHVLNFPLVAVAVGIISVSYRELRPVDS